MAIQAKLTTFDTTMIVVSLVIGIGIFRTPAMVASATARPVLFFAAWLLGGAMSFLGALTFAEIGSRFNKPGAYYKVVSENYHSSLAFMLNWTSVLIVNGAGAAAVAMIGAEYLNPIILPPGFQTQSAVQITAAGLMLILLFINYLGIKTGARVQNILSLLKIGMIGLLSLAAFLFKGAPQVTAQLPLSRPWWVALAIGFISVSYTYGGYQNTLNFGADVKSARRSVPKAIFFGILIILACYLTINTAYFLVLGVPGIAGAKLVAAEVARVCLGQSGHLFVSLAIFLSAMGFLNVTLMQMPRLYHGMADDGTLPPVFKRVNAKTQTQEFALLFLGTTILLSIFFLGTFENILNSVMFLDSLTIAIVASSIFFLRRKARLAGTEYDGFKVPFFPILPIVFILFLLSISVNVFLTQTRQALLGVIVFISGLPLFLVMRKASRKIGTTP